MGVGDDEGRFLLRERPLQNGKHLPGCWPFSHIKKRSEAFVFDTGGSRGNQKTFKAPKSNTESTSRHTKMSIRAGRRRRRVIYRLGNVFRHTHTHPYTHLIASCSVLTRN